MSFKSVKEMVSNSFKQKQHDLGPTYLESMTNQQCMPGMDSRKELEFNDLLKCLKDQTTCIETSTPGMSFGNEMNIQELTRLANFNKNNGFGIQSSGQYEMEESFDRVYQLKLDHFELLKMNTELNQELSKNRAICNTLKMVIQTKDKELEDLKIHLLKKNRRSVGELNGQQSNLNKPTFIWRKTINNS